MILTFGLLSAVSLAGLGVALRHAEQEQATTEFRAEVRRACDELSKEVRRQAERDAKLVDNACRPSELVDKVAVEMEAGRLDEHRTRLAQLVPPRRSAYDLDELLLGSSRGEVVGADPKGLLATPARELERELAKEPGKVELRLTEPRALVTSCRLRSRGGNVGMIGARHLDPLVQRIAGALGVVAVLDGATSTSAPTDARETCALRDDFGRSLNLTVSKSTSELDHKLERLNTLVVLGLLISVGITLLIAIVLGRSLGRPLEQLANEARRVATGEAKPLKVTGSGEVRELVIAFDKMIADLAHTRQRLSDASRVAAWREVARRVAHEVKNPLAPIRAAVETLRRLRARQDPAFDDYFDEATRTVLDEVFRISNIVTEFTRFARLPKPKPQPIDVRDTVESVLTLSRAAANDVQIVVEDLLVRREVRADRDQIIQVLTNLVQNATDALTGQGDARVVIRLLEVDAEHVAITVSDNGPGIDPQMAERLFEPYATNKAKGTGLGLAIAQRIAIEHEGALRLVPKSALSRGASFELLLPRAGPTEAGLEGTDGEERADRSLSP
jgi:signal transduction histidine kinase